MREAIRQLKARTASPVPTARALRWLEADVFPHVTPALADRFFAWSLSTLNTGDGYRAWLERAALWLENAGDDIAGDPPRHIHSIIAGSRHDIPAAVNQATNEHGREAVLTWAIAASCDTCSHTRNAGNAVLKHLGGDHAT